MSDTDDLPSPPDVAGILLDGVSPYVISRHENRNLCHSTQIEPGEDGMAHPIYYYVATQVAMGKTVAELCAACDFNVEDGPMMGSSEVQFSTPLRTEVPYMVSGEILSLVRKRSRKLGVMDVLTYRLRLHGPDGAMALETDNVWILPRRELA
ncbi:hypothetical protein [Rhizorhapis sp.]|uniref:hypothetical protein n=1 Tax=Rhizorhapis sp. TaxID=1968842 RepID=UPI002B45F0D8|nr:hypothetical protein [Rhizorhapis sp.]HKR17930.1 hypothetical protein [Rhizorhapis sp.]